MAKFQAAIFRTGGRCGFSGRKSKTIISAINSAISNAGADFIAGTAWDARWKHPDFGPDKTIFIEETTRYMLKECRRKRNWTLWSMTDECGDCTLEIRRISE